VSAWLRRHAAFLGLLAVAAAVRLYGLGWLPSPAGDEGNWTLYGLRMLQGRPVALAPDAAFVSLLYARLIAASMAVLGHTFFASRLIGVIAVLASLVAVYAVLGGLGSWRAGLAAAAVLALHPWAILYARVSSVPYALALGLMTAGPVLFAAGVLRRRLSLVCAGILLVSGAIHFSPLALVAAAACAGFLVWPEHRWVLGRVATWVTAAIAAAHAAPVLLGAAHVAQAAPDLAQPGSFWMHLGGYAHMMGTGLMGEATLRHFTSAALPARIATLLVLPLLAVVVLAARGSTPPLLGRFAELYFACGLLLTPLILAPGRNWYLPANHMDRYLFALLPGFALLAGELAWRNRRGRDFALALVLGWLALGTARAAVALLKGGGVDHGELIFDGGGGYRGWLVSDRPRATAFRIRDAVLREAAGKPAALLVADRVFMPLVFAMDGTSVVVHDVRRTPIPPEEGGLYFVVLWPDTVLSVGHPPTANPKYVDSNRRLRERMGRLFHQVRLVEPIRQPDGSPLLEIWRAEDPRPRLQTAPPDQDDETEDRAEERPGG
jgi:hypothetical protein